MKQLKTDLFRFITLRSPQLISKERRKIGFVEHPSHRDSFFLKEIIGELDLIAAKQKLQAVTGNYTPFRSVSEVKDFGGNLWDFSMWLGRQKNDLDNTTALNQEISQAGSFPGSKVLEIWDNVFYDILTQENLHVRQACLQLLVAAYFLDNNNSYTTTKELKRLANAKVVVPTVFSNKATTPNTIPNGGGVIAHRQTINAAEKAQNQKYEKVVAETTIHKLDGIKSELLELDYRYQEDYKVAFDKKAKLHEEKQTKLLAEYFAKNKIPTDLSEEEIENLNIPQEFISTFDFSYSKPLSKRYTSRKISDEARAFIEQNRLFNASIKEGVKKVDQEIRVQNKIATQYIDNKPKTILLRGVELRTQVTYVPTYTIGVNAMFFPIIPSSWKIDVDFLFNAGYPNAAFTTANFTIKIGHGGSYETYQVTEQDITRLPYPSDPNMIYSLLKTVILPVSRFGDIYHVIVEGGFTLDNGKKYTFTSKHTLPNNNSTGTAAGEVSPVSNDENIVHYGVNKIGVADYMRVEQELCCYIPGEVSHIENVLAKEYKERATRRLVRSEDTYESSTENEVEELSDSTSTVKNEMSSEVANVVTRDKSVNLGVDTGVKGEYTKISVHANFSGDFSYAQSNSNSNSFAKNYAQDVTRRALERVVQKTSIKRTSKIIKEFEESNKHGYDNRKGGKHVTGVFRWLDKVYKNNLINYGKRLIYEFMLPEPAKYYKELIQLKTTSSSSGGGGNQIGEIPEKPEHPSTYGINDASSITRDKYQEYSAYYGIHNPTVPLPPEEILSQLYQQSVGNPSSSAFKSPSTLQGATPFNIPLDYTGTSMQCTGSYEFRRRSKPSWYLNVSIGSMATRTYDSPQNQWQLATAPIAFGNSTGTPLNWTGTVNVGASSRKVTEYSFTVEVTCTLKPSVFTQWQQDIYADIMAAYQQQLNDYDQAVIDSGNDDDDTTVEESTTLHTNPGYTKQFINAEIKRLCIEMLLAPFNMPQGKDFYTNSTCDNGNKLYSLVLSDDLDTYARQVKFFEQAFDWEILSSIFYPYYWAKKCDWQDIFQSQDSADHVLQAFLMAGMSRVMVPIRKGFEDAVTFFMETGEIWNGIGLVIDSDEELYLSIVDEVMHVEGTVEETWETIVPTALTIVQEKSALLRDSGLPCCEKDEKNLLVPDENTLTIIEPKE